MDKTIVDKATVSAAIIGGIGDIIFGLEGFKEIKSANENITTKCYLCSHASNSIELVQANPYVDKIINIQFSQNDMNHFNELAQKTKYDLNYLGDAKNFCYTKNPYIYIPSEICAKIDSIINSYKLERQFNDKIIIIHPRGSSFSRYFLGEKRNVSTKELAITYWQLLLNHLRKYENISIILIGNKSDTETASDIVKIFSPINKANDSQNLQDINIFNWTGKFQLLETIALILKSNFVIGVDSFAKSISLAAKIPTIVYVNNHEDKFRDEIFLDPYQHESYAKIIHSANVINANILSLETINFMENFI